jgi:hypothetical protein
LANQVQCCQQWTDGASRFCLTQLADDGSCRVAATGSRAPSADIADAQRPTRKTRLISRRHPKLHIRSDQRGLRPAEARGHRSLVDGGGFGAGRFGRASSSARRLECGWSWRLQAPSRIASLTGHCRAQSHQAKSSAASGDELDGPAWGEGDAAVCCPANRSAARSHREHRKHHVGAAQPTRPSVLRLSTLDGHTHCGYESTSALWAAERAAAGERLAGVGRPALVRYAANMLSVGGPA